MDVVNLKIKVHEAIRDGVLTLEARKNKLGSTAIDEVLDTYFGGTLSGTVLKIGGNETMVQGGHVHCVIEGATGFTLYARATPIQAALAFSAQGSTIHLTVTVTLPEGYGFADSFTALKDRRGPINELSLKDCTMTLRSEQVDAVVFESALETKGPLEVLPRLAPSAFAVGALTLHGVIHPNRMGNGTPEFELQTLDSFPLELGAGYSLDTRVRVRSEVDPATDLSIKVELVTKLVTPQLELPVVLPLYGGDQYLLSFHLDRSRPVADLKSLGDLAGFTVEKPAELLALGPSLDKAQFSLDRLSALVDPAARQVVSLQLRIRLGVSWPIVKHVLELEEVGTELIVHYPGVPKSRSTRASIFGRLKLGDNTSLDASVLLPDGVFQASLVEGSSIDVIEAMETLGNGLRLPGKSVRGSLKIEKLEVYAQVREGEKSSYALEVSTTGELEVFEGLVLEEIAFSAVYEKGAFAEAQLSGSLAFGPLRLRMSMRAVQ